MPCWLRISGIIMFWPPCYGISICFDDVIFSTFVKPHSKFYTLGITFYPSNEIEFVFSLFPNWLQYQNYFLWNDGIFSKNALILLNYSDRMVALIKWSVFNFKEIWWCERIIIIIIYYVFLVNYVIFFECTNYITLW